MIEIKVIQGSEAWHEARMGRFTASKFAKVMAGESTATYKDLIALTAAEIISGATEDDYSSAAMERGVELEPEAAAAYAKLTGADITESGLIIPDEDDLLHDWVGVSPDRIVHPDGILEIKCPLMKTHINYLLAGRMPNEYKWQVQGQLMVTGADWCDFFSYHPDMKPFLLRVYPDKEMIYELKGRILQAIDDVKRTIEFYKNA